MELEIGTEMTSCDFDLLYDQCALALGITASDCSLTVELKRRVASPCQQFSDLLFIYNGNTIELYLHSARILKCDGEPLFPP